MNTFVVDCSVSLAWCFEDEKSALADSALEAFQNGWRALAPALWSFEMANAVAMAERRSRITESKTRLLIHYIEALPITLAAGTPSTSALLDLSRRFDLSAYDAGYLELAIRESAPLATLDKTLARAAKKAGARLWTKTGAARRV